MSPGTRQPLNSARRQHDVLVDLARRPSLHAGRLNAALREIAEAAAEASVIVPAIVPVTVCA